MRSDFKALAKLLVWAFAVAIVVIGLGFANAIGGWLTKETAAKVMLVCIMAGGVGGWWLFGSALMRKPPEDKPVDSDTNPEDS